MKQAIFILAVLASALSVTSCKKNWECTRSYSANPNDPNSSVVTQNMEITAKKKREAKLECEAFADEAGKDTKWDLKAK